MGNTYDAQTIKDAAAGLCKQSAATQHFQLGVEFYRAGDYVAARGQLETALGQRLLAFLLHISLITEKQRNIRVAIEDKERFQPRSALSRRQPKLMQRPGACCSGASNRPAASRVRRLFRPRLPWPRPARLAVLNPGLDADAASAAGCSQHFTSPIGRGCDWDFSPRWQLSYAA